MTDLAELRAIAEKATPGPWEHDPNGTHGKYIRTRPGADGQYQIIGALDYAHDPLPNADFVAAFSPAVALALVAVAEAAARLRAEFPSPRDPSAYLSPRHSDVLKVTADLRDRLAVLEAALKETR